MRFILSVLRDDKGLSLLEASIVLALIGVVGATALPYLSQQRHQGRLKKTLSTQEVIFQSLANYALSHGKLPCPADSVQRGKALDRCCDGSAVGSVPYVTLGLAKSYAYDGWGHPHIYAVNFHLTQVQTWGEKDKLQESLEELCQKIATPLRISLPAQEMVTSHESDPLAVILISRGEAGHQPKGRGEVQNEKGDLHFADFPYSSRADCLHRHHLKWWTRNNFLGHYANFSCPSFLSKKENKKTLDNSEENFDDTL